jgi:RNA polymerase sigma factor (sigma-70 family)
MTPDGPAAPAPATRRGAVFPDTSWTLLEAACDTAERGQLAREEFTVRYYKPVRAYIAAIVRDPEQTDELTQSFFERVVLSGRLLRAADPKRGSFRPYLKQALRNFTIDHLRHQTLGGAQIVRPEEDTRGWEALPSGPRPPSPETEYHNAWVRALLERTLEEVRQLCLARGQAVHFELFRGRYFGEAAEPPSWRELGERFGLDEKAARNRTETVARHFRVLLRQTLVADTGSIAAADDEIAALLALL